MNLDINEVQTLLSITKKINFIDKLVRVVYDINLITKHNYKIKYNISDNEYATLNNIKNKCGINMLYMICVHSYNYKH